MEYLTVIVLILASASAYQVQRLENIHGFPQQVEYDSSFNTYISAANGSDNDEYYRFYKLDANYNTIASQDFQKILRIIVNKQDDVYIFTTDSPQDWGQMESVYWLQAGSTEIEFLFDVEIGSKFYDNPLFQETNHMIDGNDNVYFNGKSGVIFFRPNQHVPLAIGNLTGIQFVDHEVDSNDTVFLLASTGEVYFITKEAKLEPTPYAQLVPVVVEDFTLWKDSIFFTEREGNKLSLKEISDHIVTNSSILSQYDVHYKLISTGNNDRLLVIGGNRRSNYLYYITPTKEVVTVKGNLSLAVYFTGHAISSDGTVYLTDIYNTIPQILMLKHDESELQAINIPNEVIIADLITDEKENLWIIGKKLYILKKGDVNVTEVADLQGTIRSLKVQEGRQPLNLLISTLQGLYLCTEN